MKLYENTYSNRLNFSGDPQKALALGRSILAQKELLLDSVTDVGFEADTTQLDFDGQDPLRSISSVSIHANSSQISIDGELGNIKRTISMLSFVLGGILILFVASLYWMRDATLDPAYALDYTPFLGIVFVLFFAPVYMARAQAKRCTTALDRLLVNMARAGGDNSHIMPKTRSRFKTATIAMIGCALCGMGVLILHWTITAKRMISPRDAIRVVTPGTQQLDLKQSATYIVYHEYNRPSNRESTNAEKTLNGLTLLITENASSDLLPMERPNNRPHYSIRKENKIGYAVYKFQAITGGTHTISTEYGSAVAEGQAVLVIAPYHPRPFNDLVYQFFGFMAFISGVLMVASVVNQEKS